MKDEDIIQMLSSSSTRDRGFVLLLDNYQERLYWHVRKIVNTHEDANDVIQNTMIKVYRNIGKFEGKSKLFTWIYRIATNEAISYIKKQKRHQAITIDDQEANVHQLKSDPYFDGNELELKLLSAVKTLPERQQIVFNLRYYEAMPYAQISEVLSVSQGALKASFHHAVKKIQSLIKSGGYE